MTTFKTHLNEIQAKYIKKDQPNAKITSSKCAEEVLRNVFPIDLNHREAFIVLYLNRANNTVGYNITSLGGLSSTGADSRVIFQHALLCNASSMVLCHNHPSGNLKPSEADIQVTNKIKELGKLLDVQVLDHLIISEEGFYSFADEGLI